jgi:hypothetical protein
MMTNLPALRGDAILHTIGRQALEQNGSNVHSEFGGVKILVMILKKTCLGRSEREHT